MEKAYKILSEDCFEVMDKWVEEGKSFDIVITDPPYGIDLTPQRKTSQFKHTKVLNDNTLDWLPKLTKQLHALSNNIVVMFCPWQHIDKFKGALEKEFTIKNILVWNKDWFGMGNNYRPNYELIILACKKNFTTKSNNKSNILTYRRIAPTKLKHSCEKPVDLLYDLIEELTKEGDTVLDPFMGSGSTGVACINTNRRFIGIEKDPKYFEIAKQRLEEAGENNNGK